LRQEVLATRDANDLKIAGPVVLFRGPFELQGEAHGRDGCIYASNICLRLQDDGILTGMERGLLLPSDETGGVAEVSGQISGGFWRRDGQMEFDYLFQDGGLYLYRGTFDPVSRFFIGEWFPKALGWRGAADNNRGSFAFQMRRGGETLPSFVCEEHYATSVKAFLQVFHKGHRACLLLRGIRVKRHSLMVSMTHPIAFDLETLQLKQMSTPVGKISVTIGQCDSTLALREGTGVLEMSGIFVYYQRRLLLPCMQVPLPALARNCGAFGIVETDGLPLATGPKRLNLSLSDWSLLEASLQQQFVYFLQRRGMLRDGAIERAFSGNSAGGRQPPSSKGESLKKTSICVGERYGVDCRTIREIWDHTLGMSATRDLSVEASVQRPAVCAVTPQLGLDNQKYGRLGYNQNGAPKRPMCTKHNRSVPKKRKQIEGMEMFEPGSMVWVSDVEGGHCPRGLRNCAQFQARNTFFNAGHWRFGASLPSVVTWWSTTSFLYQKDHAAMVNGRKSLYWDGGAIQTVLSSREGALIQAAILSGPVTTGRMQGIVNKMLGHDGWCLVECLDKGIGTDQAWLVACMMENLHLRQVNETASKIMPATKRSEIRRGRLGRHASSLGRMKCPNELPPMSLSLQARCRTTLLRLLKCESATRLEKERFAGRCLIHYFSFVRCIR